MNPRIPQRAALLACAAFLTLAGHGQPPPIAPAKPGRLEVLEMKAVPDGHFLVNLFLDGQERLLNLQVKENLVTGANTSYSRLKGLHGRFQSIGNGVFLISLQGEAHRATQFWVFHPDGSAAVKEIPDRGEKQQALPVPTDSLEPPKPATSR